ncbi:MAG: 50S ribosomal protein L17 [Gemmataceae bacterium]|nr:50S ribosomal protein L17 [Gemmataceae bacterium]
MRHLKAGRKLGRNATHRLALMRNLTRALIEHERIVTTVEKAKEARRFIERIITLAKKGTLHARRLVRARLGSVATAELLDKEEEFTGDTVLSKLFKDVAPRFQDRPGGYTRIIKRHERRLGDAGHTAFLELLKAGETKVRARTPAPAPTAPRVTETAPPKAEEKPAEEKPAKEGE